jgi:phage/plasmid-like protein (TIGR03299 family)
MAHELLIEGGRAAMFYVEKPPWHGLGTRLEAPPSSQHAIRAARLDWQLAKVPLYVAGGARLHEVKDRFALVRADTLGRPDCAIFGLAGREYQPLQNSDAFRFFDPIIRSGRAAYETAGALGDGRRVWVLARLQGDLEIDEGDAARRYLLLSNSHDGRSSLQVKFTPVRVVCNNTLTLALGQGGTIRIRHDQFMAHELDRAKSLLGLVEQKYDELETLFQRMAATRVAVDAVQKYLRGVFPDPADSGDRRAAQKTERLRQLAYHLAHHGAGNQNAIDASTIWTAYNGVTELIDHGRGTRRGPDCSTRRLHSVWFGHGAAVKARAFSLATEWLEEAS